MITNIEKTLPGFSVVSEDDIMVIKNHENEIVARYDGKSAWEVDREQTGAEAVTTLLMRSDYHIKYHGDDKKKQDEPVKQDQRPASGCGMAIAVLQQLRGGWGTEGVFTSIEVNHNEKTVTLTTSSKNVAESAYKRYQGERRVNFVRSMGKRLIAEIPLDLVNLETLFE